MISKYRLSYAQNREDVIIDAFFPDVKKGFYVDVGANHPFYHSLTYIFYKRGWRGVNYEPNPMLMEQLKKHRPKDTNIMQGISDTKGSLKLRVYHSTDGLEGISTFSSAMQLAYEDNKTVDNRNFTDIEVEVDTLAHSLETLKVPHIHFMKIDIEGFEYEAIKGNDWKKFRPELICIESNHIMKDWRKLLRAADYAPVFNDGLNDYYLAKESEYRAKYFDYAKVFLGNKPVVGYDLGESLHQVELLRAEKGRLDSELRLAYSEIKRLNDLIAQITPLTKHFVRQVKMHLLRRKMP